MVLLRQAGVVLLKKHRVVCSSSTEWSCSSSMGWSCLSTMEQLKAAGMVLHVLQHPKHCIQSHDWPFLPLLEILLCLEKSPRHVCASRDPKGALVKLPVPKGLLLMLNEDTGDFGWLNFETFQTQRSSHFPSEQLQLHQP